MACGSIGNTIFHLSEHEKSQNLVTRSLSQ
jgi:hypothetical protein